MQFYTPTRLTFYVHCPKLNPSIQAPSKTQMFYSATKSLALHHPLLCSISDMEHSNSAIWAETPSQSIHRLLFRQISSTENLAVGDKRYYIQTSGVNTLLYIL